MIINNIMIFVVWSLFISNTAIFGVTSYIIIINNLGDQDIEFFWEHCEEFQLIILLLGVSNYKILSEKKRAFLFFTSVFSIFLGLILIAKILLDLTSKPINSSEFNFIYILWLLLVILGAIYSMKFVLKIHRAVRKRK